MTDKRTCFTCKHWMYNGVYTGCDKCILPIGIMYCRHYEKVEESEDKNNAV